MAEFINPIGKIRGKFGNVIPYVGKNGKNYCRSTSLERKAGGEGQKRQSVAFAAAPPPLRRRRRADWPVFHPAGRKKGMPAAGAAWETPPQAAPVWS